MNMLQLESHAEMPGFPVKVYYERIMDQDDFNWHLARIELAAQKVEADIEIKRINIEIEQWKVKHNV